jgi:hypothetical protein
MTGTGLSLVLLFRTDPAQQPPARQPTRNAPLAASGSPAGPSSAAPDGNGRASSTPVASTEDLTEVCDLTYFPQSPAYSGAGPHPISIAVKGRMDLPSRVTKSFYGQPPGNTASARQAWEPTDPASVRLVACIDLVDGGRQIRTCKFDDPQPDTLPLSEGVYQLTLYEVATRRKVVETRVTGDEDDCPYIVLIGNTRMLYTEISERQIVNMLKRYVEGPSVG